MWLGIDAGGTHTEALVGDGAVRGRGEGGPCNALRETSDTLRRSLGDASGAALRRAGRLRDALQGVCVGMAGVGDPAARAQAFSVLEELFPGVPLHLCTDGHVALVGAFGAGPGIMVQVGTGAIALSSDGRRCGGWGWMVGDEGSAVDLGRRALRRALQAMDGRRHATLLGPAIMDRWGLAELKHAVGRVHDAPHPARLLADLFPLLVEVAAQEDAAAIEILWNGGLKLARLAVALLHPALPVAAGGGVFRYSPVTFEAFAQAVEKASGVRPEMARKSPAEGALWLATNR